MARVALTVYQTVGGGQKLTTITPQLIGAGGNSIPNDGSTKLLVINGSASPTTVNINTPAKVGGLDVAEVGQAVPAGERWVFGPFDPSIYNQSDGSVYFDVSAATTIEVAAFRP